MEKVLRQEISLRITFYLEILYSNSLAKNILRWYLNKEKTSLELYAHEINKKKFICPCM